MKKCLILILLVLLLLSACIPQNPDLPPTDPTNSQQLTQPHSPTDSTTVPTQPPATKDQWYSAIKVTNYFDEWSIRIIEWNNVFYFITNEGLCSWDPATEKETLLVAGNIWGLSISNDHLYYYTEFQIFELVLAEEVTSVPIWEHPLRYDDPAVEICGLMVHDGWIYIKVNGISAIRYDPKNDVTEEFPGDFSHFVFVDDRCYYIDNVDTTFTIYDIDAKTKESKIVRGDGVNKKFGNSDDMHYDELRSIRGDLYFYIRETEQFYRLNDNAADVPFVDNAWILGSYAYPNLCYTVIEGSNICIYEEDESGKSGLILSLPKEEIYSVGYGEYVLVTESAVFYKAGEDAPVQFAWKYTSKES